MLYVSDDIQIPMEEFELSFARSGGPGGQYVNKVSTKATLRWNIAVSDSIDDGIKERFCQSFGNRITNDGELVLTSQRFRDQKSNVDDCLDKLKEMILSVEKEPVKRKKTRPTKTMREKRLDEKKKLSQKKDGRRPPVVE